MQQWETIFSILYIWPMPFWVLLILGKRTEFTAKVIMFGGIAPLALTYTILLALTMTGQMDLGGNIVGSPDPTSLAGAMAFLASEGGATMGWIHFLAIDLLAGLWVARIADQHGIHRIGQLLILIATFVAGPVGLTLFLIMQLFQKKRSKNEVGSD